MNRLKKIAKWTGVVIAGALTLIALLLLDRFSAARHAAPQIQGEKEITAALGSSVTQSSLVTVSAPVTILRDKNAVPHIEAQSEKDALFAFGYAHGQDRLWQMELLRRVGTGRLAEVFGPPALSIDRFFRTLGFAHLADDTYAALPGGMKELLDAYAAGVNASMSGREKPLPLEFQLLFHEPEPWEPRHSLVMVKMLGLGLSANAFDEIARARLARDLPPTSFQEFFGVEEELAPFLVGELGKLFQKAPLTRTASAWPDLGPIGASNNWVVSGEHTKSGKPLLANDPHLGMLAPSLWYLVHLQNPVGSPAEGEARNLVGATIPGIPSVLLGRNDRIAWGLTNTRPDSQDLFIERLNPDNPDEYETPDGFAAFKLREERIKVRFGSDEVLSVRATRHGPVLPEETVAGAPSLEEGHVLALAWPALEPGDLTVAAGYKMSRAENFTGFLDALRDEYVSPMQSIVYGDIDGNIGFIAPAHIPLRGPAHRTKGLMPAEGWLRDNDWTGIIPFDALPQLYNPASGIIASANHKIVDDNYPYQLALDWNAPYRAIRIYELLEAGGDFTAQDFAGMQMDNLSLFAARVLPLLLEHLPKAQKETAEGKLLAAWNHSLDAEKAAPLIYAAFLHELPKTLWADELGASFDSYKSPRSDFLLSIFEGARPNAHWCDDTQTEETESCAAQTGKAFEAAMAGLHETYGEAPQDWAWGAAHPVINNHIPGGSLPFLKNWLSLETPSAGGMHTLNRGQYRGSGAQPFANIHAAGFRAVYDFADLDGSLYMISTGQSGDPYSPYYGNLLEDWAAGRTITISTRKDVYSEGALGTLTLRPAAR